MMHIVFACLLALAAARPDDSYSAPGGRSFDSSDEIRILRDERFHPEDGTYTFDFETEDGIIRSESGGRLPVDGSPVGQQGNIEFTFPNGERFTLKFVANENGYQPESPFLPVAPAFPHPIPDFVLQQIEKARREDEEEARSGPSGRYGHDDSDEK